MHPTRQWKVRASEPDSRWTQEFVVVLAGAIQIVLLALLASAWGRF